MFDVKWIRENPKAFDLGLRRRGVEPKGKQIIELDAARRDLITLCQGLQEKRNKTSILIGSNKGKGESIEELLTEVGDLKQQLQEGEGRIK